MQRLYFFKMTSINYPFTVKRQQIVDGIDIAFCDEGKGEQTFLFIHGLANYFPSWKHQIVSLKDQYRCVAIDLPGNGLSSSGDFPFSIFFYAECVAKFIEKLELKNVVLCGHSMGGQIAIVIALRYPHLLEKLILISPAGFEYYNSNEVFMLQQGLAIGDFFYSDAMHVETAIRQSFFKQNVEESQLIADLKKIMDKHSKKNWKEMVTGSIKGMLNEQVSSFIRNITCPTLIIFGDKDQLIPNRMLHYGDTPESIAKYGASMIENAKLKLINNAGHFVHIEKSEEVNCEIREFMSKLSNEE